MKIWLHLPKVGKAEARISFHHLKKSTQGRTDHIITESLSPRPKHKRVFCVVDVALSLPLYQVRLVAQANRLWAKIPRRLDFGLYLHGGLRSTGKTQHQERLPNKRQSLQSLVLISFPFFLNHYFQRQTWRSMAMLLYQVAMMVQKWVILYPEDKREAFLQKVS